MASAHTYLAQFVVEVKLGKVAMSLSLLDRLPLPGINVQFFPNSRLLRKCLTEVGLPDTLAILGIHTDISVNRVQLNQLGFNAE